MMEDLSLHILDIVENSIRAGAKNIEIKIVEDEKKDFLVIEIKDDGQGMNKEMLNKVLDPFITTKSGRQIGLGLPFLAQAAKLANGDFFIDSKPGKGTVVRASFQHSNIDRQPLGDIKATLATLIISNPNVDFVFRYRKNKSDYFLNTKELKAKANYNPRDYKQIINYLDNSLKRKNKILFGKSL
ncbi:MAG: ATP-binding protein [Candidatus Aminicenantia bacterium]